MGRRPIAVPTADAALLALVLLGMAAAVMAVT